METPRYTVETDSNMIRWLKNPGYGYIARERGGIRARINQGADMSAAEVDRLWELARSPQPGRAP